MIRAGAPGAYRPAKDRWGRFPSLARALGGPTFWVVDRRVARLHPSVAAAAREQGILVRAGEGAKTLAVLEAVSARAARLPRAGTLVAVGGGTVGDLATVAAHLLRRGVRLIQVPTTLLAAVDSSLGGKGAVHAAHGRRQVKNALGVFHYPEETWLCPELFTTLTARQRREGAIEAWKMFLTLDARRFERFEGGQPALIRAARALKAAVCAADPYETHGPRRVLNFGHTLGHVIESVTGFRVSHGDAVGLGMLCALDVGVRLGVTDPEVARDAERQLSARAGILGRRALARALGAASDREVLALLRADKKAGGAGELYFVLLERVGRAAVREVPAKLVSELLPRWRAGQGR